MAGGSATFARAAFGDGISFLAGWMLCLDYIVTSAIFSIPAIGYISYFIPALKEPIWLGTAAIILLLSLLVLNVIGIRESVSFTLILSLLGIVSEITLIILGLVLVLIPTGSLIAWPSTFNIGSITPGPSWSDFIQGITLAMVSYLGIEALAQAAEETKIAGKTIPRATMLTLGSVIIIYLLISVVAVNLVPPNGPNGLSTKWANDPLSGVASMIPVAGWLMAAWIAILGCSISIVGANAGLIGSSRMLYAMSDFKLLPSVFGTTHKKFRTPHISVVTIGFGSIVLVALSTFVATGQSGETALVLLGSLYNVGALISYVNAHASVIVTRNTDPARFRPYKMPFSMHFMRRGKRLEIPVIPVAGFIVTGAIWVAVIATHELGRLLGLVWVIIGMSMYLYYRRKSKLPLWGRAET